MLLTMSNGYGQVSEQIVPLDENVANRSDIEKIPPKKGTPFKRPSQEELLEEKVLVNIDLGTNSVPDDEDTWYYEMDYLTPFFTTHKGKLPEESNDLNSPKHVNGQYGYNLFSQQPFSDGPSVPLDNTAALNKNGDLLSATNNSIRLKDSHGYIELLTLHNFFQGTLKAPCDPKVFYDSRSNKFLVYAQENDRFDAFGAPKICLAVMTDEDPYNRWSYYVIDGDKGELFDYPKVAISHNSIIITGTVYRRDNSIVTVKVYQLERSSVIAGTKVNYRFWDNFENETCFVLPVHSYDSDSGSPIYLISNKWVDGTTKCWLYTIDSDVNDDDGRMKLYEVERNAFTRYFCYAEQNKGYRVDNMDLRIMDGFLYQGKIVYTFINGNDKRYSKISLNVLNPHDLENKSLLIGYEPQTSYTFPSINWLKSSGNDVELVIHYCGVSSNGYPKAYCATTNFNLSNYTEVVIGESDNYLDTYDKTPDLKEEPINRWGDYTSIVKHPVKNILILSTSLVKNSNSGTPKLVTCNFELSFEQKPQILDNLNILRQGYIYFDADDTRSTTKNRE